MNLSEVADAGIGGLRDQSECSASGLACVQNKKPGERCHDDGAVSNEVRISPNSPVFDLATHDRAMTQRKSAEQRILEGVKDRKRCILRKL